MKSKRINLTEEPLEKNKAFTQALLTAGLDQEDHEFNEQIGIGPIYKVDGLVEGMTLEKFLAGMDDTGVVLLDFGVTGPRRIDYSASYRKTPLHTFVLTSSSSTSNYDKIKDLFQEIYGKDMEAMKSEPLPNF
ncbi:MAG: hypothetical protein KAT77_00875 [Nanoarchaeota archaeon]|nr:hypothetical protein [Nanoarchaeota archaeon]